MQRRELARGRVGTETIVTASVLLVGVLLVAHGYYRPSHSGLYAGLAVTLAGVLCGTVQIVMPRWRGPGAGISPHDRP